ncbi:DUF5719 family protein [Serinicoccus sp. LYQ131]|uniref:DUF5719 family protein n=1 Tax=Serinicoccus sp. LYQ131 TaxID=3378797 RepID=UPI003853545C
MTTRRRFTALRAGVLTLGLAALVGWGITDGAWGDRPTGAVPFADPSAPTSSSPAGGEPVEDAFVRSAALGCPGVDGIGGAVRAATGPPELLAAAHAGGTAEVGLHIVGTSPEGTAGAPDATLAAGGASQLLQLGADVGAVLEGGDVAAPGLVGGQLAVSTGTGDRGALLAPCTQGSESLWLLAGDDGAGRSEQVVLTNPGTDPVQVELEVRDEDGPVEGAGDSGIVVPGGAQVVRVLDALAPGVAAPAVGVRSTGGPVVAHLLEREQDGTTDLGRSVSAAVADPARDLVVPALPTEDAELTLRVLAPEAEALVELRVLGEAGAAAPAEAAVRVPAGGTVDLPLEDLPEGVAGLRLRSDAPVTAAVLLRKVPDGDDPVAVDDAASTSAAPDDAASTSAAPDDAASTSAAPGEEQDTVVRPAGDLTWTGATVLTRTPVGMAVPPVPSALPDADLALAVSAVDATSAEVLWLDAEGAVVSEEITLANDTSVRLEVPDGTAAVWVRSTGAVGIAAALHVSGQDALGPYAASATLPAVPWTREVTGVLRQVP